MREAFSVIDQGLATAEDVDNAVRYAFGFRYVAAGPILQKELAGLETQLEAGRTIYPSLNNSPDPSPGLARLVAEGKLGPKTGEGFRPWPAEKTAKERARYEKALLAAAVAKSWVANTFFIRRVGPGPPPVLTVLAFFWPGALYFTTTLPPSSRPPSRTLRALQWVACSVCCGRALPLGVVVANVCVKTSVPPFIFKTAWCWRASRFSRCRSLSPCWYRPLSATSLSSGERLTARPFRAAMACTTAPSVVGLGHLNRRWL
jgi:hypothetical protein